MKRIFLFLIPIVIAGTSCDGILDPRPNSDLTTDDVWQHATYGEGLLGEAYSNLNYDYGIGMANFTDNAVPATQGSNDIALGGWTVENNPIGNWDNYYLSIRYINTFLENARDLSYEVGAPEQDSLLRSHRIGEAYFLRAWYEWKLLQEYAGYVDGDPEPKGFPIVTTVLEAEDDVNLSRDSYEDGVAQIEADLDSALARLPMKYNGSGDVFGNSNRGRGSGLAALALKSRLHLYAASPAYGSSDQELWERAAQSAYDAIQEAGGLSNLDSYGNFNDFGDFNEYIWIQPATNAGNNLEQQYYPPSLFGNGVLNPSQNLVDAFPASDGYPIEQSSEYDSDDPYENRDPRFERFIFHNGEQYNNTFVRTYEGGADAPGGLSRQGTRTGYYLQKHTSRSVQLNPGDETTDIHFKVFLSKKELYLNFAEAANEAWGPDDSRLGFSAADALGEIRERAGIDSDPNTAGYQDDYLDDRANAGQDAFRELVHNERRLELSFEGHRFWDIRRWNEPLNHTVRGINITASEDGQGERHNVALDSEPSTDFVSGWESIDAINDGVEPSSSSDEPNYGNWDSSGEWRYVQYDFPDYMVIGGTDNTFSVDSSAVYWWRDGGGVRLPDSVYIQYWDENAEDWTEVSNHSGYGTAADQWNGTSFDPVETSSIRLNMKHDTQSTGIVEWQVWGEPENPPAISYDKVDVETHTFQDYMRYIPVPYNETLIMSNLKQNEGWQ
jgi:hypothetical protein